MTTPIPDDPRCRDDSHLVDLIERARQAETGNPARWRVPPRNRTPATAWARLPTGNDLVRRLAEPIRFCFESTRMYVLGGLVPEPLLVRGAHMGPASVGGALLNGEGRGGEPREWQLPAEGEVPAIRLRPYRQPDGRMRLHCAVSDDFNPGQVSVRLRDAAGDLLFRGPLSVLAGNDLELVPGSSTLELVFTHTSPPAVREIPLDIGLLPDR